MANRNNGKELIAPCRTMSDLVSCLSMPSHCVPTVEFAVRNISLPLSQEDYSWLNADQINIFAANQGTGQVNRTYARSNNLTDMTLTFDVPFVLLGICVYAYGEPFGMSIPGNCFDRAVVGASANSPASPLNLRNQAAALAAMTTEGTLTAGQVNPAVIEWGSAVWKLIWAFMHSRRLVMKCPSSSYDILLDESLADLGNCCSQTEWGGFGSSKADHMMYTRMVNDRLSGADSFTLPTGVTDPGVFFPCNCDITSDASSHLLVEPVRLMPDFANFGRSMTTPAVESWYRLPCPIPFPTVPAPKIKISLDKSNGDDPFLERALAEGSIQDILPDAAAGSHFFPLNEQPPFGAPNLGYANEIRLPGGQLRIGIGLKGFEVRQSVCDGLMEMYEGKSFPEISEYVAQQAALKPMSGTTRIKMGCAGPVGAPDEE